MAPSLSKSDELFLKSMFQRLHEGPLQAEVPADREFYVPVYERLAQAGEPDADPVTQLARQITYSQSESVQFFSGFKGSGKTTELLRLKQRLGQEGYIVLYANALDYLNPSGPIDISDLLIAIASALSEQLRDPAVLGKDPKLPDFGERFVALLRKLKIDASLNLPWLSLKAELKESPSLRQSMQKALASHINDLYGEVRGFVQECVRRTDEHQAQQGAGHRSIVVLFDSLEQLRGTLSTEAQVQESVERVFTNHLNKLKFPYLHIVYTVPPWLKFATGAVGQMVVLPSVRQWNPDPGRTPYAPGQEALTQVLLQRFGDEGLIRLFCPRDLAKEPSQAVAPKEQALRAVQPLVDHCGGHFRDLLRLVNQAMLATQSLPISSRVIQYAIQKTREDYLPLLVPDARWLQRIGQTRAADPQTPEDRGRLIRFLDGHLVLYLRNGHEWYDVHPLIRQEVDAVVARNSQ